MHLVLDIAEATLLVVAALFPIVNPLSGALIFLGLTEGSSRSLRQSLARRISINGFLILLVSMLIGGKVLAFFGVSLPVVQVAGGLVVFAMGWNMLQQKEGDPKPAAATPQDASAQAFYPLTLPLTVGPGSISVAVALGANTQRQMYGWPAQWASAILGPLLIAISILICYRSADRIEGFLGRTGMSVFLRLSAFILICIGIQICWNGIAALTHLPH
ncbi:MAG TPA: MarC family protein [Terriglobales bacterium]|nr:MarC family protein [Terriglobales bacterium]